MFSKRCEPESISAYTRFRSNSCQRDKGNICKWKRSEENGRTGFEALDAGCRLSGGARVEVLLTLACRFLRVNHKLCKAHHFCYREKAAFMSRAWGVRWIRVRVVVGEPLVVPSS